MAPTAASPESNPCPFAPIEVSTSTHAQTWRNIWMSIPSCRGSPHNQSRYSQLGLRVHPVRNRCHICFSAFPCARPGLCMNMLTIPTACVMYGPIATITYIREPTTGSYGTNFMWFPSGLGVGKSFHDSHRLAGNGRDVGLAVAKLKCLQM